MPRCRAHGPGLFGDDHERLAVRISTRPSPTSTPGSRLIGVAWCQRIIAWSLLIALLRSSRAPRLTTSPRSSASSLTATACRSGSCPGLALPIRPYVDALAAALTAHRPAAEGRDFGSGRIARYVDQRRATASVTQARRDQVPNAKIAYVAQRHRRSVGCWGSFDNFRRAGAQGKLSAVATAACHRLY